MIRGSKKHPDFNFGDYQKQTHPIGGIVLNYLSGMSQEARIGYLCYQAARRQLAPEEECELTWNIANDPEIIALIEIEALLKEMSGK